MVGKIALLVAALAACGNGAASKACPQRAADIATHLRSVNQEPSFFVHDSKLVTRADLPADPGGHGPLVQASTAVVRFQGSEVADEYELRERFEATRRKLEDSAQLRGDPEPIVLFLVIDEDVPWETVGWIARSAQLAGFSELAFGFALPKVEIKRPPPSKLDAELDALMASDDQDKAGKLGELTRKAIAGCPALQEAFADAGSDVRVSRTDAVLDAIEPALVKCGCDFDVDSFHAVMFRLVHVQDATTTLRVKLAEDGKPVTFPAATPWREAGMRLKAGESITIAAP